MLTWRTTNPGSCFQRPRILGLWLMFLKDQKFWILAHVFRGLGFLDLGSCFQRTKVLDPGSCFQRPRSEERRVGKECA